MDQLKKGRMNPTVQKFYLTCKSWDLTLVKYDSGKVFFLSVLHVYGITLIWLMEISCSSKLREPLNAVVDIKTQCLYLGWD